MSDQHLVPTPLDHVTAWGVIVFGLFVIIMIAGPARILARERDELRSAQVRELMAATQLLKILRPEEYDNLLNDLRIQQGLKLMVGEGSCVGNFGRVCQDEVIADTCLHLDDYFTEEILDQAPVDPKHELYSDQVTGYYFATYNGVLEIGACGVAFGEITLRR